MQKPHHYIEKLKKTNSSQCLVEECTVFQICCYRVKYLLIVPLTKPPFLPIFEWLRIITMLAAYALDQCVTFLHLACTQCSNYTVLLHFVLLANEREALAAGDMEDS